MAKYHVGQASQILGVSVDTLWRWASPGRILLTVAADGGGRFDAADFVGIATKVVRPGDGE